MKTFNWKLITVALVVCFFGAIGCGSEEEANSELQVASGKGDDQQSLVEQCIPGVNTINYVFGEGSIEACKRDLNCSGNCFLSRPATEEWCCLTSSPASPISNSSVKCTEAEALKQFGKECKPDGSNVACNRVELLVTLKGMIGRRYNITQQDYNRCKQNVLNGI